MVPSKTSRILRCPDCGRVASVPPWTARPICVHAWDGCTPEVWNGDDVDGEGRRIEDSPNEAYRTSGPETWTAMEPFKPWMLPRADWFLYTCTDCAQRTLLGPEGGDLNPCGCPDGITPDAHITPLYAGGRLHGRRMCELHDIAERQRAYDY